MVYTPAQDSNKRFKHQRSFYSLLNIEQSVCSCSKMVKQVPLSTYYPHLATQFCKWFSSSELNGSVLKKETLTVHIDEAVEELQVQISGLDSQSRFILFSLYDSEWCFIC